MSQTFHMSESAFSELERHNADILKQFQRIDHGGEEVRLTQIASGHTLKAVYDQLDETQRQMKPHGAEMIHRTSIGRNTSCPCGSGRKFKKCCIDKVAVVD